MNYSGTYWKANSSPSRCYVKIGKPVLSRYDEYELVYFTSKGSDVGEVLHSGCSINDDFIENHDEISEQEYKLALIKSTLR